MIESKEETGGEKIDNEDIQAQCAQFLLAGYETSSTTLGFICYQLALNTHIQDKVRDEADRLWPGDEVNSVEFAEVPTKRRRFVVRSLKSTRLEIYFCYFWAKDSHCTYLHPGVKESQRQLLGRTWQRIVVRRLACRIMPRKSV